MTKIRKNIWITRLGVLFGTIFIMGSSLFVSDDYKYIPLSIGLVWDIAFYIYGIIKVRCPFCRKGLPIYLNMHCCPNCGLDLDKESE